MKMEILNNKYAIGTVIGAALLSVIRKRKGGANIYKDNANGLEFWGEGEIKLRNEFISDLVSRLKSEIKPISVMEIDAPILTPNKSISKSYKKKNLVKGSNDLTLRPQSAPGTYAMAEKILQSGRKLPLAIWQHGKVFSKTTSKKVEESYELSFQIIYAEDHPKISSNNIIKAVKDEIQDYIGRCRVSDTHSSYHSKWIKSIERSSNGMSVATISERHDFTPKLTAKHYKDGIVVIEVKINTDKIIYNHQKWKNKR
jgi:hypothetical protein